MKTLPLGRTDLMVSSLAYGCMEISGGWDRAKVDAEAVKRGISIVETAVDAGYTLFDHADIYGDTASESIFGQALKLHPGWRDRMVIVTKCGIRFDDDPAPGAPHRYDFSHDHIIRSAHGSLQRLGIDTIDLLLLHRPDFLADPDEVARAFIQLRQEGKVREFGVSNFRPSLLSAVQKALPFPLQANQVEIHLRRLDPFTDGTLDQCLELGITPMSWSPLARGRLATGFTPDPSDESAARFTLLLKELDAAAEAADAERTTMSLAWLLRHPSRIIPIIGSTNPARIRSAAKAADIEMDRETWYKILVAARGQKLP